MITDTSITFADLGLHEAIQRALTEKNYTQPSPIQARAIPHLLEGKDVLGCAQTGTGKTAAFALPILHKLASNPAPRVSRHPRALVLTPTRELAVQIGESFATYGKHLRLRHTLVYGGVGQFPQMRSLHQGTDIVVATPGRLLDLYEQEAIEFSKIEFLVLDEADRMLDMGFAPDVKRIISKIGPERQSLLFSATMPESIRSLAASILRDPVKIEIAPVATTAELIEQRICHVKRDDKLALLQHYLDIHSDGLVLLFTRTKHGADKLVKQLSREGKRAEAIHGNKSQAMRQRALDAFRLGKVRILVATDIAARGIDVKGIELVVNYDMPDEPESYVHRIGRTARAGKTGVALSFCDPEERSNLRAIQRTIKLAIPVEKDHPHAIEYKEEPAPAAHRPFRRPFGGRPQGGRPYGNGGGRPQYGERRGYSSHSRPQSRAR